MSLRRVVAFFLLLAVSVSSVEVVIGGEARFIDAAAAQTVDDTADSPESPGDTEDCECLCACLCAGAQLVVAPAAVAGPLNIEVAEARVVEARRSPTLPSPRPPHRPPLV